MSRVVTAVQKITTEFNNAVSDKAKIVAITKTALNLEKQNGH
jgi:methionine-rich copper-binding protein CopC